MPMRTEINNTQARSHKIAKFFNNKFQNMHILRNKYNKKFKRNCKGNHTTNINQINKLITTYIKDLYTN